MKKAPAVIVLGMHRSGTSMLASCLIRLGVNMGERLLAADEANPFGYYEDVDFLSLNKKIIFSAGGEWNMPVNRKAFFPLLDLYAPRIHALIEARQKHNAGRLWGWKDPRNCLTAWMYHELFREKPRYVIIYRDRQDILKSLLKRNSDAVNWGRLCKQYNQHIEAFLTIEKPKIFFLQYELMILCEDAAKLVLTQLCHFLGSDLGKIPRALEMIKFRQESPHEI